ncbi:MAG TPA: hypothetical protein VGX25_25055 [Actinophytocola sp.]|uniref:hypothetical protein n=1 Tax=Actinophytocola sp. TaxID=1872138 RepID=UPI002DDCFF54|nr:hypothetical protein [Actinophytocola sp.]HEV2782673.1 hypothetical protein [Actinophytocola sp.]
MTDDPVADLPTAFRSDSIKVVADADIEQFLRSDDGSRQVIELRLHGNTVVARSKRWRNVVYNIRRDLRAVIESAGFLSATYLTDDMAGRLVTGALTCLSCWQLLATGRNTPLTERHAVVISQLMMARLHGLDADPNIVANLRAMFKSRHWDLEAVIIDLQQIGVIGADQSRTRLTLRDRVLILPADD